MTLEALLTFAGILLAALAIARPLQRRSLALFVPVWCLAAAMVVSFALIICRDAPFGVSPPFGWSLPDVIFGLTVGAFVVPVVAALGSWVCWHRARLTGSRMGRVENLFQAALREHEFDEVERILRKNRQGLARLPATAADVLFQPAMIAALMESRSLIHLELLAHMEFLKSLDNRLSAVEAVVRELVRAGVSPLRGAVVWRFGGLEGLTYSGRERTLIETTFQNPEWYTQANAHYPLLMAAVEALRSGELDAVYNNVGQHYEARQGIATRSHCPIYLATKVHVLAIEAALEKGVEKDLYVTDLFDVFNAVQDRSRFNEAVWESSLSYWEHPTPYAYLMYEITGDLRDLCVTALKGAASKTTPPQVLAPGEVARALALTWSLCVWSIAESGNQVSARFRNHMIKSYLMFVLEIGWEPSQLHLGWAVGEVQGLQVWRDLFMEELRKRFGGQCDVPTGQLKEAVGSLDQFKRCVYEGKSWLEEKLFGHLPSG